MNITFATQNIGSSCALQILALLSFVWSCGLHAGGACCHGLSSLLQIYREGHLFSGYGSFLNLAERLGLMNSELQ